VQYIKQIARDRLSIICNALLVRGPPDLGLDFITVLLDNEADELLEEPT
jgi:hypothetical protein